MSGPILIAGGGPAGALLALRLARGGAAVTLLESGTGGGGKLCGEFLSGEAARWLQEAGLENLWDGLGGAALHEVALHGADAAAARAPLPAPAQGISRAVLDPALRAAAAAAGAHVVTGARVTGAAGGPGAWRVRLAGGRGELNAAVLVAADGRRAALALPARSDARTKHPWGARPLRLAPGHFAMQFHFRSTIKDAADDGATHLHFFPGGYCGVNGVEGGAGNCCFLLPRAQLAAAHADPLRWLRARLGSEFLAGAEEIPATRHAAGPLEFGRWRNYQPGIFALGDAAVAIDPFCGDGMAMAMEGALLAAPRVAAAAESPALSPALAAQVRAQLRRRFAPRLLAAGVLRRAALHPALGRFTTALLARHPGWLTALAARTRFMPRAAA